MKTYSEILTAHYETNWYQQSVRRVWREGPFHELPDDFCILEFGPFQAREMWTYATCGMSQPNDTRRVELHMFSPIKTDELVELLTVVSHYHRSGDPLNLWHTVNFGRGWLSQSTCEYGLVSLPYLDGPDIENAEIDGIVKNYWLIPISKSEVEYKKQFGVDSLEEKLETTGFNYLDPNRTSVV